MRKLKRLKKQEMIDIFLQKDDGTDDIYTSLLREWLKVVTKKELQKVLNKESFK